MRRLFSTSPGKASVFGLPRSLAYPPKHIKSVKKFIDGFEELKGLDSDLLVQALTWHSALHNSINESSSSLRHLDQFKWTCIKFALIGDSLLRFWVLDYMSQHFPLFSTEKMHAKTQEYVSNLTLAHVCVEMKLNGLIVMNPSFERSNVSPYVQASAVEALIAASYFGLGADQSQRFGNAHIIPRLIDFNRGTQRKDHFPADAFADLIRSKCNDNPVFKVIDCEDPSLVRVRMSARGLKPVYGTCKDMKSAKELIVQRILKDPGMLKED